MPTETVQNVLDAARTWLSDNGVVSTGEIFTNAVLLPHYSTAYRKMYNAMANLGTPRIRREFYHMMPAYTTILQPTVIGVTDMAEPEFMDERIGVTQVAITSTNTASPIQVTTSTPHNYASNSTDVIITEVSGTQVPWGRWFVTVVDPSNFTLNGSTSDGNAGSGGFASTSTDKFVPMDFIDSLTDRDISDKLRDVVWEENVLKFRGATQAVQIRVTYIASGNPPQGTSTVIGIDDCLNFLGCYTAAIAAGAKTWNSIADRLGRLALGTTPERDGSGGYLRDFTNSQVKKMQRAQRRRRPFRKKRSQFDYIWS
jgi:hypothetical protein